MSEDDRTVTPPTVLVADDDSHIRTLLRYNLERAGFRVLLAADGREAMQALGEAVAVALLDLRMPVLSGMDCLRRIRDDGLDTQVIVITASHEIPDAVQAMKSGAFDYVTKPIDMEALVALVRQAARTADLSRENRRLKQAIGDAYAGTPFIGNAPAVRTLLAQAERVAALASTVMITGESGVGKGLLARMIHASSPRADKPFVAVNCVALPRELVESELFGHERGSFTGAHERRIGRLEIAHGGTIFLDEIGDMPIDLQPKLLNFLQESAFQRVGGNELVRVDVRVLTATHQDLPALCRERRFREDLYFRINVLPLHIPPLREHREDIAPLAAHILARIARKRGAAPFTLHRDTLAALAAYDWPGNVRELENALERASAFCAGAVITPHDLPSDLVPGRRAATPSGAALAGRTLEDIEREALRETLALCRGNRADAARRLGISEKSVYNKIKRFGLA